jgi:hypothetical protein
MRLFICSLFFFVLNVSAAEDTNSINLDKIYLSDQQDRQGDASKFDWDKILDRDSVRREQVIVLLRNGQIRTAKEYWQAAMIFQHGETTEQYKMAYVLTQLATLLDPEMKSAKWLSAAAWDRIMLSVKQPQWYGTQFQQSSTGKWELCEINPKIVTDEERVQANLEPLLQIRAHIEEKNKN